MALLFCWGMSGKPVFLDKGALAGRAPFVAPQYIAWLDPPMSADGV